MQIILKLVDERVVAMEVTTSMSVSTLKSTMSEMCGVPASEMRLKSGMVSNLEDSCTLGDYDIRNGATIVSLLRLYGGSRRKVAYFYDGAVDYISQLIWTSVITSSISGDIGHYYYGPGHPMKPHRLKLAHHLILTYGLYRKMEVYRPHRAEVEVCCPCRSMGLKFCQQAEEMARFHSPEYIDFLRRLTGGEASKPGTQHSAQTQVSIIRYFKKMERL